MGSTEKFRQDISLLEMILVKDLFDPVGQRQYSDGDISKELLKGYAESVIRLSSRYLGGGEVPLTDHEVRAYSLYYLPINFIKAAFLLDKLPKEEGKSMSVLDFGCGPGSASLAAISTLAKVESVTLCDLSKDALHFASNLCRKWSDENSKQVSIDLDPSALKKSVSYDLVIAANVITEMEHTVQKDTVVQLLGRVKSGGFLIILEPALQTTTRNLMMLRDILVKDRPDLSLFFPCPHDLACPMDKKDWCHGEIDESLWERPKLVKQLDKITGFNKHRIKYSAFIFQKEVPQGSRASKLIRTSDNKRPALICSPEGLINIHPKSVEDIELRRLLKKGESYSKIEGPFKANR